MRRSTFLVLFALLAFATSAWAKPSDWDDVLEKPGDKSVLPRPGQNAPDVVSKAHAKPAKATSAKQGKKAKTKKAPRRAKAKRSRR
jgi:hypothetical protein